jgi:ABC-type sugar transport system permease subunit
MAVLPVTQARRSGIRRFFADQRKWMPYVFVAPFFITFAIFTLYPIVWGLVIAFQESLGYSNQWEWVGLANFQEALTDDRRLGVAFRNVILFSLGSFLTQVPVAFTLALLLTSRAIRARGLLRTLFYIPVALPGVTIGVIGVWFFSKDRGFANALLLALGADQRVDWTGYAQYVIPIMLMLAFWQYVGNHTIFFIAGLSGMDPALNEAAIVDGATLWQRVRYITIPLLKPVFTYVTITMTAGSLMIYEVAVVVFGNAWAGGTAGPADQGWFLLPYITWLGFDQFRLGYAASIGWLVFMVALILTIVQLKLFRFGEVQ